MDKPFSVKKTFKEGDPVVLIDFLEKYTSLSKGAIKKVLNNGGVWLRKYSSSKRVRVRRAQTEINSESHIEFFYDPKLVNLEIPEAREVMAKKDWGVWYKPPGLLSQGTDYGDHCSILRQVEKAKGKAFLVHRLDREAHGLMVFAYTPKMASTFSQMWQKSRVDKIYKVEVVGNIAKRYPKGGKIDFKLDGKDALTTFTILEQKEESAILLVQIHTGRLHQIRRHFEELGYPVLGDPKYGTHNKNEAGIRLMAYQLAFLDPESKRELTITLDDVVF